MFLVLEHITIVFIQHFDGRVTQQSFLATVVFVNKQLFRDSPIITLVMQVCGYDAISKCIWTLHGLYNYIIKSYCFSEIKIPNYIQDTVALL